MVLTLQRCGQKSLHPRQETIDRPAKVKPGECRSGVIEMGNSLLYSLLGHCAGLNPGEELHARVNLGLDRAILLHLSTLPGISAAKWL